MKLKVVYEKIVGFSNPVKKAERTIDWAWILLVLTVIITMIIALRKML